MLAWLVPAMLVLSVALLTGLSEEAGLSARVRHTIPVRQLFRRVAFLFYNGPAGALCWVLLLGGLTVALTLCGGVWVKRGGRDHNVLEVTQAFSSFLLYMLAYGLTAGLIWRRFFAHRFRAAMVWVIAAVLVMIGALSPSLAALLLGDYSWRDPLAWHMGNVFTVGARDYRSAHLVFAAFWAGVVLTLNGRWLLQQFRDFVPPSRDAV